MPIDAACQVAELRETRAAAIRELRLTFEQYGLDVSAYNDHEVSSAVVEEASATTCCSWDLFVRAFERMKQSRVAAA